MLIRAYKADTGKLAWTSVYSNAMNGSDEMLRAYLR